MKLYFFILISSLGFLPYSQPVVPQAFNAVISAESPCGDIPALNKKIIDFVNSKMNKKVGRGECWDLAAEALNQNGANWDKSFKFGKEVDIKTECVYPGDIVQFENVLVEYKQGTSTFKEKMQQHTAIVYEVKKEGELVLADQNTNIRGKKVGLSPLNLNAIKKGKYTIYRPEEK